MITNIFFDLLFKKITMLRWKKITFVLFLLVTLVYVNLNENAFALSAHCNDERSPYCSTVGYDEGKQNPIPTCLSGNSQHPCQGRDTDADTKNSNEIQYVNHNSLSISSTSKTNQEATLVFFVMLVSIAGLITLQLRKRRKPKERRGFPQNVKENVLRKQDHKCAHCKKLLNVVDWDHKNGNRSDNKESNCQALCPNCHAIKTRRAQSKR